MHIVLLRIFLVVLFQVPAAPPGDSPIPPQILGGIPLNDLLEKCQGKRLPESPEPPPLLPAKAKGAINVLTPSGVDTSPFLHAATIAWPAALAEAKAERTRLVTALAVARKEAAKGKVSDNTVKEVRDAAAKLDKHLVDQVEELSPSQYIQAKRLVNRLKGTGKAVAAATFRADLALAEQASKVRTTADLVRWMNEKKLKFAPALPGQEEAYREMYRALADHQRKAAAGRK